MTEPRPLQLLYAAGRDYPGAWREVEQMRAQRSDLGDWPVWCYLPLAGAYAVVSGGGEGRVSPEQSADVARIGALAAWRAAQGIYRLHPELLAAVRETPLGSELPIDLLYRLPEWCCYVEMSGDLAGFFVWLEYDMNTHAHELRLLLDHTDGLVSLILELSPHATVSDCIAAIMMRTAERVGPLPAGASGADAIARTTELVTPLVSVVLYLCSQSAEHRDARGSDRRPGPPPPRKTKRGLRSFAPDAPTTWEVSYRLGAALLAARESNRQGTGVAGRAGPRPHIRRAHWHTYLSGPREGERRRELRWLPPIAVAVDDVEDLVPTVRVVE